MKKDNHNSIIGYFLDNLKKLDIFSNLSEGFKIVAVTGARKAKYLNQIL